MKNREEEALFAGRIRDLARQAQQNEYLTHTGFLSLSEQSLASAVLEGRMKGNPGSVGSHAGHGGHAAESLSGIRSFFYGGNTEADRKILFFLPSYLEREDVTAQEDAGEGVISCLKICVRGARFVREIGHRDCLGALMHLGIGREQIGDILLTKDGSCAYAFVLSSMADHICRELGTIGRAHVDIEITPPAACTVRPVLEPRSGSVASVRIDSLISLVFHMSRSAAQDLVGREEVFADGRTVISSSWTPSPGCRISVRGHGKFIYEGEEKTTRKGRVLVKTSVFV